MNTTTISPHRGHRRWTRIAGAGIATLAVLAASACSAADSTTSAAAPASPVANLASGDLSHGADNFYTSDQVTMQPVIFKNQYKMDVSGNLFVPKNLAPGTRAAAMVVGHPMGAVKEQSANLYATKMAEQGFVTLALDLAYWGGSAGEPRNAVAPDLYTETFSAGVDFLRTQNSVDPERIGALGICGSGSFVISAAKIDPRIKAVATVSMYDMGAANRNGLGHSVTPEQRQAMLAQAATPIEREFYDFYRTQRGAFTPEGTTPDLTTHPTLSSNAKFMNFYPFNDIETISPRPMLFVTGENAHSREFSEEAYRLAGNRKELVIVPGAGHVDLYDRTDLIPFDKLTEFYTQNLA
ncbi:alpha/beta hydrolase [Rhodococcus sp. NPDC019627]|uniref:alpha/beta hydrolase n=1 Tax=unclassified Rhodococcus (in: high G+C Gram-positive bacteria) TaxID=192944 RepID=UPI0033E934D0